MKSSVESLMPITEILFPTNCVPWTLLQLHETEQDNYATEMVNRSTCIHDDCEDEHNRMGPILLKNIEEEIVR